MSRGRRTPGLHSVYSRHEMQGGVSWECWSVLAPVRICAPCVCTDLLLCSLLLCGVSVTIRWGKEPDFYLGIKVSLGKLQQWGDRKKPGGSPVFLGGAWAGCCWEREDGQGWMELPAPSRD